MVIANPLAFTANFRRMRLTCHYGCLLVLFIEGVWLVAAGFCHEPAAPPNAAGPDAKSVPTQPESSARSFGIQKQDGVDWLFSPDGNRFFPLGVCCVDMGASRGQFDPENPGYAAWRQYQEPLHWADNTLRRLKSWGFNTIGGWSDYRTLAKSREMNLSFTLVLHIGSTAGAPWWDMWDPKVIGRMDQAARDQILAVKDDPRLIGYFSDNEMGWWNATLFKMTLEQPTTSGQRQRLLRLLRERYQDDWNKLLDEFEPEGAENWNELEQRGMLYLRPGGQGIHLMRRFLGLLADRYYSLVQQIIRRYDRRALILGDRFQSFYYPEVARASAPYLDAISSNLNAHWNDGSFARFYLESLHTLSGKPILISEVYAAGMENRSGNKNNHGIFPVVQTQRQRAAAFRQTLTALAKVPYVIGVDWFQYYDEPIHGRGDGENFNFGLVDIHDRPYVEITTAAASINPSQLKAQPALPRLDVSQGVPRAPKDPMGQFEPTMALKHWDREGGFVKPLSECPLADLYVCWNEQALYFGLYALDIVEDAYYRDRVVPKSDRAEWTVQAGGWAKPIRARLGAGREPIASEPTVRVLNLSGVNLDVRNIACLELPAGLLGQKRLKAGTSIEFSSTLLTHCQAYRMEWKGILKLKR